jgi:hypothetical protein
LVGALLGVLVLLGGKSCGSEKKNQLLHGPIVARAWRR